MVNQRPHVAPADWSTGSPTEWDEASIYPRDGGLFALDATRKTVSRTNNFKLATVEGHCYVGHGSWKVQLQAQQHNERGDIAVDYVGVQVAGTQCAYVGCDDGVLRSFDYSARGAERAAADELAGSAGGVGGGFTERQRAALALALESQARRRQ